FHGDVAVKGDRILAIGRVEGDAKRGIDATALVVAPGFIDMHSHSDWTLLEDGNAQSKIRQGVTTEVIGESTSAGPFKGKLKPRTVSVTNESIEIRADRKSTRLNSSHQIISYAVFCLKKKIKT